MNKYVFKTLFCSALALPLFTSCELDQYPEGSLPTEKTWEKMADAANYDIGMLALLRGVSGGSQAYVSEVQSDLFNARIGTSDCNQTHQWTFTATQFDGDGKWSGNYNLIANANNVLNNIGNIQVEAGSEDESYINIYKGTAYFARALAYTNMVTRYCQNYDAATADNTLGLPLVTTVDISAKPARATLAQTYAMILSDIEQARTLLADFNEGTSRPSIDAVTALEARVSLQMNNYDKAIELSEELIAKYPLIEDADEFADMWLNDDGSEIIFQPVQTKDERSNSYSGIFIGWDDAQKAFNPQYIPTQGLIDLYEENDMRLGAYFAYELISANDKVDQGYIFNKFPGNPALKKTSQYEYYNMTKVFRVAEFYLTAAEASYKKNGTDGGYLTILRAARGASELSVTGDELWKAIQNEWVREMVGEGFRLDCLKRWNEGCKRMEPQAFSEMMLISTNGYTNLDIEPGYFKFIWEIPSQDTQSNGNIQRNWPAVE